MGTRLKSVRNMAARWVRRARVPASYQARLAKELDVFNQVENVHALPEIFHYWSHRYLRPKFEAVGVRGIYEFFADAMGACCAKDSGTCKFISIGAGSGEIEIEIVALLMASGHKNFTLECLDINEKMLARGKEMAEARGFGSHMAFIKADASGWRPSRGEYTLVMAHQSLHHIVELETLFDKISKALVEGGLFLTSDVIGRNGHMRWPEAMEEIDCIWREMPDRFKYNHALKRFEERYENWDCSSAGFEGIRAQDILSLLIERFSFEMFLGYGNLIDIFVDRAFGHNFSPENAEDRAWIDRIAQRDDLLIESGTLKPTHIIAVMRPRCGGRARPAVLQYKHLSPEFCLRPTGKTLAAGGM